ATALPRRSAGFRPRCAIAYRLTAILAWAVVRSRGRSAAGGCTSSRPPRTRPKACVTATVMKVPTISVVLPVYNERENLDALVSRLIPALRKAAGEDFEVLFVDDGSSDGSNDILDAFHARDRRLKAVHFSRNFGHQAALQAGDFCLLERRVVDTLGTLPERNRFLRGLRSWVGFKQIGIEYERDARHAGEPKYTLRKLVRLALSGYIGFSAMPLRAATWLGFVSASAGFALALWAVITKLVDIPSPRGWASTVAIFLFVSGVQLFMLGVVREYLSRVYDEVRNRPLYIVRSRTGIAGEVPVEEEAPVRRAPRG